MSLEGFFLFLKLFACVEYPLFFGISLTLDALVKWVVVVCVTREDSEIVVCLVLDQWVVPAVANEHVLQVDVLSARDILLVLLHEILGHDRGIVAACTRR